MCDNCDHIFSLWDDMEELFASYVIRRQVEDLQTVDAIELDTRRKGKLLALEVVRELQVRTRSALKFRLPKMKVSIWKLNLPMTMEKERARGYTCN